MGKCNYVVHDKINKNKFNIFTKEKIFFDGPRKMII